jgi:hypothetical protein
VETKTGRFGEGLHYTSGCGQEDVYWRGGNAGICLFSLVDCSVVAKVSDENGRGVVDTTGCFVEENLRRRCNQEIYCRHEAPIEGSRRAEGLALLWGEVAEGGLGGERRLKISDDHGWG